MLAEEGREHDDLIFASGGLFKGKDLMLSCWVTDIVDAGSPHFPVQVAKGAAVHCDEQVGQAEPFDLPDRNLTMTICLYFLINLFTCNGKLLLSFHKSSGE